MEWKPIFEINLVPYEIYLSSKLIYVDENVHNIFGKKLYNNHKNCIIYGNYRLNGELYNYLKTHKKYPEKQKKKKLFHLKRNKERREKLSNI